jgi:hypothetical protein
MAWSYRQDRSDEVYHNQVGPVLVEAEKLPHTPSSSQHAKEMLDPDLVKKREEEEKKLQEIRQKEREELLKQQTQAQSEQEKAPVPARVASGQEKEANKAQKK